MFRLSGCPAVRLSGCSVVRLFSCSAARLFSCSAARRNRWAEAGRIDVSGDAGCIPAVLSGIGFRLGPAFRACFGICFSGRRIRLCNFCRSSFRRRACNSLLPVFLDLCRVPMI